MKKANFYLYLCKYVSPYWIKKHIIDGISIIQMEILCVLFRNTYAAKHSCLFYLDNWWARNSSINKHKPSKNILYCN